MKLSELIRDYVDLKIEGEPKHSEWSSIDSNHCRRENFRQSLNDLEAAIDEFAKAAEALPANHLPFRPKSKETEMLESGASLMQPLPLSLHIDATGQIIHSSWAPAKPQGAA